MCFNNYEPRTIEGGKVGAKGFRLYLGNTITVIFIMEFACKVIAQGFIFGENSYIDDAWNKLDFIVVVTGYVYYKFLLLTSS